MARNINFRQSGNIVGVIGRGLADRVQRLVDNRVSGYVETTVSGISIGWGGTEDPIFVPTTFPVEHAVANIAKEYTLKDATRIFDFGDDLYAGEIKTRIPDSGNGFYVEFYQADPNQSWELKFNWYAVGFKSN